VTTVGDARAAAGDWVRDVAARQPGYLGAFVTGSTVYLPDPADLPESSDIDVTIVSTADELPKLGKFRYHDVLLEVTYQPYELVSSAEAVLGTFFIAGSFQVNAAGAQPEPVLGVGEHPPSNTVLDDPTGHLGRLYREVARHFAEPGWVRRRCAGVRERMIAMLGSVDGTAPWPAQVTSWLFGASMPTQLVLVAALRNPTVRLRYVAARQALADHGYADRYPELLDLLGCADLTRYQVQAHLDALARTFDASAEVARTPFFFSADITATARPVVIAGSQQLIDRGDHREAVFWIVATFARCHTILLADAPDLGRRLAPDFAAATADLGIASTGDLRRRSAQATDHLPAISAIAEEITASRTAAS
jgi:hypothetical protein